MIAGLPLDYAQARVGAHLARRPDERVWSQVRSARTVGALLEALRASPAAGDVSGVDARASADDVERALRQQLRHRIEQLARWAPQEWRAAIAWTRHLIDLPALAHLATGATAAAWMRSDPVLAELARATVAQRRSAMLAGELSPLAGTLVGAGSEALDALHPTLAAWRREWRRRWPRCDADARAQLDALERAIAAHLARFAAVPLEQTQEARDKLAARALRFVHRYPGQPVALFAYLVVAATDLERLRGQFALRAAKVP